MRGAPTSVLGSDQSAWRQGWLINDVSAVISKIDDLSVTCAHETVLLSSCNCVTLPINRKSASTVGLVVMIL
jgi:hypothetical protein